MTAHYDIEVDQEAYYSQLFTWKDSNLNPQNITGFSAKMQIREDADDEDPALVTLQDGSGITLGGTAGTILVTMPASETASLPDGNLVYDLLIIDPSNHPKRLLEGRVIVAKAVTRI